MPNPLQCGSWALGCPPPESLPPALPMGPNPRGLCPIGPSPRALVVGCVCGGGGGCCVRWQRVVATWCCWPTYPTAVRLKKCQDHSGSVIAVGVAQGAGENQNTALRKRANIQKIPHVPRVPSWLA